jgi:ribosomal protein S3AE
MTDDIVLEILKGLQASVADLAREQVAMRRDISILARDVSILTQDGRMIRAALADLGKTRVSSGEIEAMHADINSLLERMTRVEEAAGLLE